MVWILWRAAQKSKDHRFSWKWTKSCRFFSDKISGTALFCKVAQSLARWQAASKILTELHFKYMVKRPCSKEVGIVSNGEHCYSISNDEKNFSDPLKVFSQFQILPFRSCQGFFCASKGFAEHTKNLSLKISKVCSTGQLWLLLLLIIIIRLFICHTAIFLDPLI